jgi:hypothetical protein
MGSPALAAPEFRTAAPARAEPESGAAAEFRAAASLRAAAGGRHRGNPAWSSRVG